MKKKEPYSIYQMAIQRGMETDRNEGRVAETKRKLEIIFYGMACFDPLPDKSGFRVLFPNGLQASDGIPEHGAAVWVRGRNDVAVAKWPWFAWRNDYFLGEGRTLQIKGLTPEGPLDAEGFEGRVTNLQQQNKHFKIKEKLDHTDAAIIMETPVDHGVLTARVVNEKNMIAAFWNVEVEPWSRIIFSFGDAYIEIPAETKQIFLANAGASHKDEDHHRHFQLYRRLSESNEELHFKAPDPLPPPMDQLDDPTFVYEASRCPDVVCSVVQSRSREEVSHGHRGKTTTGNVGIGDPQSLS